MKTLRLDELEGLPVLGTLTWQPLRKTLGITAFGTNAYTAAADGHDFVAAVRVNDPKTPPMQLVLNWRALLSR